MNNVFKSVLLLLVGANLIVLLLMFFNKPPSPHIHAPRERIIQQLDFSNNQELQLDKLIEKHRSDFQELHQQLKEKKDQLHALLKKDEPSNQEKIIEEIVAVHAALETLHFNHLLDIKKLCQPDQLEKYNKMVDHMDKIFGPPPHPPKN